MEDPMWKTLAYLKKKLIVFIPLFMLAGLAVGSFIDVKSLKVFILPVTVMMVLPMMAALPYRSLFSSCSLKLLFLVLGVNFLILPLTGFLAGKIFLPDPFARLGLLLAAVIPTGGMTISWTAFAGGNKNAAVRLSLVSLLLSALLLPFYTSLFMGKAVPVVFSKVIVQIGVVLLLPLVVGFLFQKYMVRKRGDGHFQEKVKPRLPLVSSAALLSIIFLATALKARAVTSAPLEIVRMVPPVLFFYLTAFFLSTVLARLFLTRENGIALVYTTGLRNLSLALAVALTAFGKAGFGAAILITLAYLVQIQGAAFYHRLVIKGKVHPGIE